jgi:hypothetical protein
LALFGRHDGRTYVRADCNLWPISACFEATSARLTSKPWSGKGHGVTSRGIPGAESGCKPDSITCAPSELTSHRASGRILEYHPKRGWALVAHRRRGHAACRVAVRDPRSLCRQRLPGLRTCGTVKKRASPRRGAGDRQGDLPERPSGGRRATPRTERVGSAVGAHGRSLRGVDVLNAAAQHLFPAVGFDLGRVRRVDEVDQHPYESKRIVEVREVPRLGKKLKSAPR